MKYLLLTSNLIFVFTSFANATTYAEVKEVSLPKNEMSKVEQIACTQPHQVKAEIITAYQYESNEPKQPFDYVSVQCKSHNEFEGSPSYFTTTCNYENKKWDCGASDLHILIQIQDRTVNVEPGLLKPEVAHQMLSKISTYGSFQGISMNEAIGSHCNISKLKDNETFILDCRHKITVSSWCPQPQITHCPRVVSLDEKPWD